MTKNLSSYFFVVSNMHFMFPEPFQDKTWNENEDFIQYKDNDYYLCNFPC